MDSSEQPWSGRPRARLAMAPASSAAVWLVHMAALAAVARGGGGAVGAPAAPSVLVEPTVPLKPDDEGPGGAVRATTAASAPVPADILIGAHYFGGWYRCDGHPMKTCGSEWTSKRCRWDTMDCISVADAPMFGGLSPKGVPTTNFFTHDYPRCALPLVAQCWVPFRAPPLAAKLEKVPPSERHPDLRPGAHRCSATSPRRRRQSGPSSRQRTVPSTSSTCCTVSALLATMPPPVDRNRIRTERGFRRLKPAVRSQTTGVQSADPTRIRT